MLRFQGWKITFESDGAIIGSSRGMPIKMLSANILKIEWKLKLREKHQMQSLDTGTKNQMIALENF